MTELTLTLPLFVDLPRKTKKAKRIYLSNNVTRNLNFHSLNAAKHAIKDMVWSQLEHIPPSEALQAPVEVEVKFYTPDKRDRDLANFCCTVEKFADDAVVEFGLLEDDSVKFLKKVTYIYAGIDRNNPRFELTYKHYNTNKSFIEQIQGK